MNGMLPAMRAIVIDAGSEEGRAAVHALARGGASVLAVDLDRAAAGRTAATAPGGEVLPHAADIGVPREWAAVLARAEALWGGVDGVLRPRSAALRP
jgi:NAD(P)-dependent dehydrogenase (short-subunit alcohol dehydrogenase family)